MPTFRTRTDVVRLDVSVFDRERQPVRELTARDFTILENGAPQEIVLFEPVVLPGEVRKETVWSHDVTPDVVSNDAGDGRLWVLVLDDATVAMDLWALQAVKAIGRRIVERMDPGDRMAVVFPRRNLDVQDFTDVRPRLHAAVDAFDIGFAGMTPRHAVGADPRNVGGRLADAYFRSSSLKTLRSAVEFLTALPERRRVLVYVGTGVGVAFTQELVKAGGDRHLMVLRDVDLAILEEMKKLLERAQTAGVSVYSFDARGVGPRADFFFVLSNETGGRATVNTNDFEPGVERMFIENQSYYLIGYRTTTPDSTAYRRIEVQVNRPDVEVRTRTGYDVESERERARAEEARAKLRPSVAAVTGILPQSDLPLRLAAAPFAQRGRQEAHVALVLGADLSGLTVPITGRAVETLAVETRAFTPEGHARGQWRQSADVTVRPAARGEAPVAEVVARISLRPGRYSLRVGAHGQTIDMAGSVYADVEVPDFANAPLSLSGVVLGAEPRPGQAGERSVSGWLPIVPTSVRTFTARHAVRSFLRVYQGGRAPLEPVTVTRRLLDRDGTAVVEETDDLPPSHFGAARAADVLWRVPTTDLTPGPYLLRITATRGETTVTRDVLFRIE